MERVHVALGSCVRSPLVTAVRQLHVDVRVQPCALPIQGDLQVVGGLAGLQVG